MRRPLAAALALLALLPSPGGAGAFSEYRIPAHDWRSGLATFSVNASRGSDASPWSGWRRSDNGSGSANTEFARGFDSDRRQHGWRLGGGGDWRGSHDASRRDGLPGPTFVSRDQRTQAGGEHLWASLWGRAYPAGSALGLEVAVALSAAWNQGWSRTEDAWDRPADGARSLSRQSVRSHAYRYSALLSLAAGHGIVRDATVVEDVHVLEARLLETGTLARALTPGAREALAGILAVAPRIRDAHERPERFQWREIERVLREDGALAEGRLDAFGLLRARERYRRLPEARRRGHFVGVTVALEHAHDIRREDLQAGERTLVADTLVALSYFESGLRQAAYRDLVRVGAKAEWHVPAGWRWQWTALGAVSVPARAGLHGLQADASLAGAWQVADRWGVQGTLSLARGYLDTGRPGDSGSFDGWRTALGGTLSYALEDRASVFARLDDTQARDRSGYGGPARHSHSTRLSAGLAYRFLGRVSAPGLFETMTPLR